MTENRTGSPVYPGEPGRLKFGSKAEPGCVELVPDPLNADRRPQEIHEPFIILNDSGIFSRVFLARAHTPDGKAVLSALRIQKDVPSRATPGFGRSYTNRDAVDAILREHDCRTVLSAEGEGIVPAVRVTGDDRRPIVSPPVTYCKKTAEFFHPVCPSCGGYMRDCRDEILLNKAGLPSYSESAQRVLYCPACSAGEGERATFYSSSPGIRIAQGGSARLRAGSELYRDSGRLIAGIRKGTGEPAEPGSGREQFYCLHCPHQAACYPVRESDRDRIPAEELLYPVSYYEFTALLREMYELRYDEFCQLIGGRDWNELKSQLGQRLPFSALGPQGAALDERFSSKLRFFSAPADGTPDAWEVLWLKLGVFEQICEGVDSIYESCGRPHLNLNPRDVLVSPLKLAAGGPAAWSFRAGIINPAAAIPVAIEGKPVGEDRPCFLNPLDANPLYTSPAVRRPPFGHEEYANVVVRGVTPKEAGADIEADLTSEVLGAFKLNENDLFRVTLNVPGSELDRLNFWAGGARAVPGGYRVTGHITRSRPGVAEVLAKVLEQTLWDCRINICRRYQVTCDLYSLGMLLLSGLSANDENSETEVCRAVEDISRKLNMFASRGTPEPVVVEQELRKMLASYPKMFAPESVLYRASDRDAAIDHDLGRLWFACQKLGFSMTTEIAGFSMAVGIGVAGGRQGVSPIKNVRDRLKGLNLWAEGQLFSPKTLRRELDTVISGM